MAFPYTRASVVRLINPCAPSNARRSYPSTNALEQYKALCKEFSELPFERKVSTLIQLETIAMSQALDTIADRSVAFGKLIFDTVLPDSDRPKDDQEQTSREVTSVR